MSSPIYYLDRWKPGRYHLAMTWVTSGLRALRRSRFFYAAGIFALLWLSATPLTAANHDRKAAQRALQEARQLNAALAETSHPTREQFLRCIHKYRLVYDRDPHFGGSDDAIYEEALLYQQMGEKLGSVDDFRHSLKLFRFLLSDYPTSSFCPEALLRIGDLCTSPLADQKSAQEAYKQLRTRYARSKAAASLAARKTPPLIPTLAVQAPVPALVPVPVSVPDPAPSRSTGPTLVQSIRHWSTENYTRVAIDMTLEARYRQTQLSNPDRMYVDISNAKMDSELQNKVFAVGDDFLKQVRVGQNRSDVVRVVLDFAAVRDYSIFELHNPYRIIIDIHGKTTNARAAGAPRTQANDAGSSPITPAREIANANIPSIPAQRRDDSKDEPRPTSTPSESGTSSQPPVAAASRQPPPLQVTEIEPPVKTSDTVKTGGSAGTARAAAVSIPAPIPELNAPQPASAPPPPAPTAAEQTPTSPPYTQKPERESKALKTPIQSNDKSHGKPELPVLAAEAAASKKSTSASAPPGVIPKPAPPTSLGQRTLTRMLGLKIGRIVIDPGHGGHDTGSIGRGGLLEKNLVLDVARRLRTLIESKIGAEVILTREDDTFISLEERTAIANQHQADLFLSIHANSSRSRTISGVETYFLDFARNVESREVAARENASTVQNIRDLQNLIKKIAQADKSAESREFAAIIQRSLYGGAQQLFHETRNRGVRSAPFVVLIGANMPSILAELAFISNPRDEKLLKKEDSVERLARALLTGVEGYMKILGSDVAQNHSRSH